MPPRTRRRAGPRPAPVISQDLYTEKALHERPDKVGGNKLNGGKKRKKAGATNGSAETLTPKLLPVTLPPTEPPVGDQDGSTADSLSTDTLSADGQPLLAPPRPAPRRPGLIPTDIADTIGPVIGKAVADIKAHEDGSRRGGDIEDVHKMRVATRRVRAYLKAARPALDRTATDRIRGDVRELAGTLGVIRDHDVMIDRLHTEAGKLGDPDTGALEHLVNRLETERIRRPRPAGQRARRPVLRCAADRTGGGRRATAGRRPMGGPARTGRGRMVDAGEGAPQTAQEVRQQPTGRRTARAADLR